MSPKKAMFWVLLMLLAGAAFYFSQQAGQKIQRQEDASSRLMAPMQVARIELSGAGRKKPLVIARREKEHAWRILSPIDYPADAMAVAALIHAVMDGRITRRIPGPIDPASFGLAPARSVLTITAVDGQKAAFEFGDDTPDGKGLYLRPAGQKPGAGIWLAPSTLRQALNQSILALRDKAVLDFVAADVTGLKLALGPKPLSINKDAGAKGDKWSFGDGGAASPQEVDGLISAAHVLRARGFAEPAPPAKVSGLDRPQGRLVIKLSPDPKNPKAASQTGFILGNAAKRPGLVYAQRLGGGPVMLVAGADLKPLMPSRHKLAERRVWRLRRSQIQAYEIRRGSKTVAYKRDASQWLRVKPGAKPVKTPDAGLFLWDLVDLKWEKNLTPKGTYGLDPAQVVITITVVSPTGSKSSAGGAGVRKLSVGKLDPASGLLAARIDDESKILGISPSFLKSLPK